MVPSSATASTASRSAGRSIACPCSEFTVIWSRADDARELAAQADRVLEAEFFRERAGAGAVVLPAGQLMHLLVQRAAEGDVEFLDAAADREQRQAAGQRRTDQRQGGRVARRVVLVAGSGSRRPRRGRGRRCSDCRRPAARRCGRARRAAPRPPAGSGWGRRPRPPSARGRSATGSRAAARCRSSWSRPESRQPVSLRRHPRPQCRPLPRRQSRSAYCSIIGGRDPDRQALGNRPGGDQPLAPRIGEAPIRPACPRSGGGG